jgi:ribosome-associated protein
MIHITDSIVLNDNEIAERFVRATGPAGQNINRDATAVELRMDLARSLLPPDVKRRLVRLAGRYVTTDGVLMIISRVYRSQASNRDAARARLLKLLQAAATAPKIRRVTKPTRAMREKRLVSKDRRSAVKRSRSRRDEGW